MKRSPLRWIFVAVFVSIMAVSMLVWDVRSVIAATVVSALLGLRAAALHGGWFPRGSPFPNAIR